MLERRDVDCVLEDECDLPKNPETVEQEEVEQVSDRDYQAGFWSPPN